MNFPSEANEKQWQADPGLSQLWLSQLECMWLCVLYTCEYKHTWLWVPVCWRGYNEWGESRVCVLDDDRECSQAYMLEFMGGRVGSQGEVLRMGVCLYKSTYLCLCVLGETEGKFCVWVCAHRALPSWSLSVTLRWFTMHGGYACIQVCRGVAEKSFESLWKFSEKNLATPHTTGWYTFNACEVHFLY